MVLGARGGAGFQSLGFPQQGNPPRHSPPLSAQVVCVGQDFIHFTWSREPSTVRFADGVDVRRPEDPTQSEVQAWQVCWDRLCCFLALGCLFGFQFCADHVG